VSTTVASREAIYERFETAWGTTTPIMFDNENDSPPTEESWVRLSVRHRDSEQKALGEVGFRLYRRLGSVFLQLFTPFDSGQRQLDNLIELARPIFEGARFSGVDFTNARVQELGIVDGWNAALIEFLFSYDERR